jgi:hypothetical protein
MEFFIQFREKESVLAVQQFFSGFIFVIWLATGVIQNTLGIHQKKNFGRKVRIGASIRQ